MKKNLFYVLAVIALSLLLVGCSKKNNNDNEHKHIYDADWENLIEWTDTILDQKYHYRVCPECGEICDQELHNYVELLNKDYAVYVQDNYISISPIEVNYVCKECNYIEQDLINDCFVDKSSYAFGEEVVNIDDFYANISNKVDSANVCRIGDSKTYKYEGAWYNDYGIKLSHLSYVMLYFYENPFQELFDNDDVKVFHSKGSDGNYYYIALFNYSSTIDTFGNDYDLHNYYIFDDEYNLLRMDSSSYSLFSVSFDYVDESEFIDVIELINNYQNHCDSNDYKAIIESIINNYYYFKLLDKQSTEEEYYLYRCPNDVSNFSNSSTNVYLYKDYDGYHYVDEFENDSITSLTDITQMFEYDSIMNIIYDIIDNSNYLYSYDESNVYHYMFESKLNDKYYYIRLSFGLGSVVYNTIEIVDSHSSENRTFYAFFEYSNYNYYETIGSNIYNRFHKHGFNEAFTYDDEHHWHTSLCGHGDTIVLENHEYGEWKISTPATCAKNGEETRVCECGKTETRSIDKLQHQFGEWFVYSPAKPNSDGYERRTCSLCGDYEERKLTYIFNAEDWIFTANFFAIPNSANVNITGFYKEDSNIQSNFALEYSTVTKDEYLSSLPANMAQIKSFVSLAYDLSNLNNPQMNINYFVNGATSTENWNNALNNVFYNSELIDILNNSGSTIIYYKWVLKDSPSTIIAYSLAITNASTTKYVTVDMVANVGYVSNSTDNSNTNRVTYLYAFTDEAKASFDNEYNSYLIR